MAGEKILLVDDDPIYLKLARALLSAKGFYVETAENGAVAFEKAAASRPALIVTDFQLPDIDGLELTQSLKANPATRRIPIVLLTAMTNALDEQRARDAGCLGFLTKPIRTQTFAEQIGRFLLQAQTQAFSVAAAAALPLVLVVNDNPEERENLQQRLTENGFAAVGVHNGVEGLAEARRRMPAAIVSDLLMPEMDGFRFCREVRSDPALRSIPVVLTTSGSIQSNDEWMAKSSGANAFVLRNPDMREVVAAVRASIDAGPRQSSEMEPAVLDSLRRYFLEEGERQTLRLLDQQRSGLNRNAVRRLAHRWAGVAGTFGYPAISEAAQRLETEAQRAADSSVLRKVLLELSDLFMDAVGRR